MSVIKDIFKENSKILLLSFGLLIAASLAMVFAQNGVYDDSVIDTPKEEYTQAEQVLEDGIDYKAVIKTSFGDIQIDLFEKETPITVNSFLFLTGKRFYEDLTFHRVIPGFVIQGGDPNGDGTGGPGYKFENEITDREFKPYVLAMANAGGNNTNGSQFFITSVDISDADISNLNGNYTIFGEVTSGFAVVDSIERVDTDATDKPTNPVTIESIQILEN